jgi:hypothetical protein
VRYPRILPVVAVPLAAALMVPGVARAEDPEPRTVGSVQGSTAAPARLDRSPLAP